ncbi:MAG: sigma-70 family RNA polymerase sigma factor [Actinomycetota bacterium]
MGDSRDDRIEAHLDLIFETARAKAHQLRTNSFEADEVAQLTAYKLWRRWEDPKVATLRRIGGARWKGYIREVAKNTYVDLVRQHQRRLARQQRAHECRTGQQPNWADGEIAQVWVNNIESSLARAIVAEEILNLPPQQQKVAARMFLLEMTAREIGHELDLEPQTVRKHARAARETLRIRLAEAEEAETILP